MIVRTVNQTGLREIYEFLTDNHKQDEFTEAMLNAWAEEAEFQMGEGNPPTIEIKAWDSVSGHAVEFTVSDAGVDVEVIDDLYTINSECGLAEIYAQSLDAAKSAYSLKYDFDFDTVSSTEGSWYWIEDEDGDRLEQNTADME